MAIANPVYPVAVGLQSKIRDNRPAGFSSLRSSAMNTRVRIAALVGWVLILAHSAAAFDHFITRRGDKLFDGDQEFRFVGANMPGLVLPYDWTLYLPERLHLPTKWEQEDGLKTLAQMNFRVVRTWNLPMREPKAEARPWHYVLGPGKFNEEAFQCLDQLLALANKYQVRVILDFTAEYGDYLGGIGTYAAHRSKKRSDFYTDPQLKADYQATVAFVLNRKNTITGVPYNEDKAVLAWQFGNEMHSAPDAWLTEMAAYIKKLAPHQLVAETRHRPGQPLLIDPNIDLLTRHLYANYGGVGQGWPDAIRKEVAQIKGQRPLFIGEFGPYIDGKSLTTENVVPKMRDFLDYCRNEAGISGALLWSMYFHHQDGGYYWHQIMTYPAVWSYHWPGFASASAQRESELLALLRESAYRLEGRAIPPLPAPDAPELLPISETPLISWRGSAGATGYDLERATDGNGPWETIAANLSDADVAYRPLYSDTTAQVGRSYFYRVLARNASGRSPASNIVGPVTVKQVCLVDELQDFSRVAAKSDGLKLNNAYNALYAEYLFRAVGDQDDWLTYRVSGAMTSFNVVAFCPTGKLADLQFQVGGEIVKARRAERALPNPPGGAAGGQRRTLLEYAAELPAGQTELKILWTGPAELDRVEIRHSGAPSPK